MIFKKPSRLPGSSPISPGFTLVELLIVILIIAVLAALGSSVIGHVKSAAARTRCTEQLHSWGIVMTSYSQDHNGKIEWEAWPSISNDPLRCSPYVPYWTPDSVLKSGFDVQLTQRNCPSVKWNKAAGNSPVSYATIQPQGVNRVGNGGRSNGLSSSYLLSKISRPSRFMLMIDALPGNSYSVSTAGDFTSRVQPLTETGTNLRHEHSVDALFADLSVKSMTWPEVEQGLSSWSTF